jgi:hypothetical protein
MDKCDLVKFNLLNKSYSSGIVKDCENIYENEDVRSVLYFPPAAVPRRKDPAAGDPHIRKPLIVRSPHCRIHP